MKTDKAERIKWWDALDVITRHGGRHEDVEKALQMARECHHEDARWLVSLFDAAASDDEDHDVFQAHADDPRAMYLKHQTGLCEGSLLHRAAEAGYAPAQSAVATMYHQFRYGGGDTTGFGWATKAAAQGDRLGLCLLAQCNAEGVGCDKDIGKAVQLFREAAELGQAEAQFFFGKLAYREEDVERYRWWARAAARGHGRAIGELAGAASVLFRENGSKQLLLEIGAACEVLLEANRNTVGSDMSSREIHTLQQTVSLNRMSCARAKVAIECWIAIARRQEVVKDIRLLIVRMVWDERWLFAMVKQAE
jgi:hypothetical protein